MPSRAPRRQARAGLARLVEFTGVAVPVAHLLQDQDRQLTALGAWCSSRALGLVGVAPRRDQDALVVAISGQFGRLGDPADRDGEQARPGRRTPART